MIASFLAAATLIWIADAFGQTTTPPSILLRASSPVCARESVEEQACIALPATSKVDVFFLLDDTGTFENVPPAIGELFDSLAADLEAALPGVEFGFGVGRFEDYGGPGILFSPDSHGNPEYSSGRPFILNQPILTAADAGGASTRDGRISEALARTAPGFGGDKPETALEGLYQVATGAGFDGDGSGTTSGFRNAQPAGSFGAQKQPDSSGDVPAFLTLLADVPRSGSIGGAGFRPDALRLVVLATDFCTVTPFDPGLGIPSTVSGAGSVVPVADFACNSTEPGSERFGYVADSTDVASNTVVGAVVPKGGATLPATVAALNAAGIRVVGLFPTPATPSISAAGAPPVSGPSENPAVFLSALARLTGTADAMGNPVVVDIPTTGTPLKDAIVKAVVAATMTSTVDVELVVSGTVPAGLEVSSPPPVAVDLSAGGTACFQVTFLGSGAPNGSFNLDFQDETSGAVLGSSIPVSVACEPTSTIIPRGCGDGNVNAALGEQCDAGAANGAPGSCCDATCRLVRAGTVCRTADAACDADAVCDGATAVCPANAPKGDGALCDDGNPTTGTSACLANVCRGVALTLSIPSEITVSNPKRAAIPVVLGLAGNPGVGATTVQLQSLVACRDLPLVRACTTTKACLKIQQQLAALCPAPQGAVAFATSPRAPAGFAPVTNGVSRKFKPSRRGQVRVRLKLNKLGRALLARSTALPLQTRADVQESKGSTLSALIKTLLRRL